MDACDSLFNRCTPLLQVADTTYFETTADAGFPGMVVDGEYAVSITDVGYSVDCDECGVLRVFRGCSGRGVSRDRCGWGVLQGPRL